MNNKSNYVISVVRFFIFFKNKTNNKYYKAIINAHITIDNPPTCQASLTGGTETKTAARPPNAVYPIIPKLINPAYPIGY